MYWDVVDILPKGRRDLGVRFADGLEGIVTITPDFCTGVFEALRDDAMVLQAEAIDGVMTWPNGLDLAPDTMYRAIKTSPNGCYIAGENIPRCA